MLKAYKYSICPDKKQEILINKKELILKDGDWTHNSCQSNHDVNTSINIKNIALKTVSGADTKNQDGQHTMLIGA